MKSYFLLYGRCWWFIQIKRWCTPHKQEIFYVQLSRLIWAIQKHFVLTEYPLLIVEYLMPSLYMPMTWAIGYTCSSVEQHQIQKKQLCQNIQHVNIDCIHIYNKTLTIWYITNFHKNYISFINNNQHLIVKKTSCVSDYMPRLENVVKFLDKNYWSHTLSALSV